MTQIVPSVCGGKTKETLCVNYEGIQRNFTHLKTIIAEPSIKYTIAQFFNYSF